MDLSFKSSWHFEHNVRAEAVVTVVNTKTLRMLATDLQERRGTRTLSSTRRMQCSLLTSPACKAAHLPKPDSSVSEQSSQTLSRYLWPRISFVMNSCYAPLEVLSAWQKKERAVRSICVTV